MILRNACVAALMLPPSIMLRREAPPPTTRAVLPAALVGAVGFMARPDLALDPPAAPSWLLPGAFWSAVAAGVLIKGPLILMVVGLAAVTLVTIDRSAVWLTRVR